MYPSVSRISGSSLATYIVKESMGEATSLARARVASSSVGQMVMAEVVMCDDVCTVRITGDTRYLYNYSLLGNTNAKGESTSSVKTKGARTQEGLPGVGLGQKQYGPWHSRVQHSGQELRGMETSRNVRAACQTLSDVCRASVKCFSDELDSG